MPKFIPPAKPADLARLIQASGHVKSSGHASELSTGRRTPSYELALKLETAIGVPVGYWQTIKNPRLPSKREGAPQAAA